MESVGQILKAARERRQMTITDVVTATKMTSVFVQAVEADNFDALVAPVYARGFIKLYAECVGLDSTPLLKQYDLSRQAAPALAPLPPKTPPSKSSSAGAGKPNPPRLQRSGLWSRRKVMGKPALISKPSTSPAAGKRSLAAESGAGASSWSVSLLAKRLSALNRAFFARVRWPQSIKPDMMLRYVQLLPMVWRRILIVAGVVLLIIAASLAWEWSRRGAPTMTDACRWLAEPPAPYLTVPNR